MLHRSYLKEVTTGKSRIYIGSISEQLYLARDIGFLYLKDEEVMIMPGPGMGPGMGPGGPGMGPPPPPRRRWRGCCMPGCLMSVLGVGGVIALIVMGIAALF